MKTEFTKDEGRGTRDVSRPSSFVLHPSLTWCEVDLKAIRHNYREIKRLAGKNIAILAVIKADAYGHGMSEVAKVLDKEGVHSFGVSNVHEGVRLREKGITKPILILESPLSFQAKPIIDYQLTPTLCTVEMAVALNRYAKAVNKKVDVHIKFDTGMGRLGVWHEEAGGFIQQLSRFNNLAITGIFTHFPSADTDSKFTRQQIQSLRRLISKLDQMSLVIPYIHAANSMGLGGYKADIFNLARPGLMLYGLYPSPKLKSKIKLKPALTVKTKVIFVKGIKKGRSISYGRTFIAPRDMVVATLPIGYNDGYFRALSNKSYVLIEGKKCPILGRVTMDQIMVDVTSVKSVKPRTEAVILGRQKTEEIAADTLAACAKTINYEVVCSLGNRLPRIYKS